MIRKTALLTGVLLSLLLAGTASAQPCGGPNLPACPHDEQIPTIRDEHNFLPNILIRELQREFTVGNPPRKPFSHIPPPSWLKRTEKIPESYPMQYNNGEAFFQKP